MGKLRVIGGERKGFPLFAPAGSRLRPTANRVREAIFDILAAAVGGSRFLDLFAGTGAVGIEALSRGARHCVFVENDADALKCLQGNLERCRIETRARVVTGSLPASLSRLRAWAPYDLIFVDPPYVQNGDAAVLDGLFEYHLLTSTSRIILEHGKGRRAPERAGEFSLTRSLRYGDTLLSFFDSSVPSGETETEV